MTKNNVVRAHPNAAGMVKNVVLTLLAVAIVATLSVRRADKPVAVVVGGVREGNLKTLSDTGVTAQTLADSLAGSGVSVSPGATFTGAANAAGSLGAYTATDGNEKVVDEAIVGFSEGVVLSTGWVKGEQNRDIFCINKGLEGPNECAGGSGDNGKAGDSALDTLTGGQTKDAAVLEFSFVPATTTATLQYVFSSEDYLEGVGAGFADALGIYVNGANCATVGNPAGRVSVDSVNTTTNSGLYRDNPSKDGGGTPTLDAEPDGLTTVLTCSSSVTAGQSNTMKLAIADLGDGAIDSNAFFKKGSLTSGSAAAAPGAPTALGATGGDGKVDLSWTAPASNGGSAITGYEIFRAASSGGQGAIALATVGVVTSYSDTTAANGNTYFYKVAAVNAVGTGEMSNEASATPQGNEEEPSGSEGFSIDDVTATEGNGGGTVFRFVVRLSEAAAEEASVRFTTRAGTATRGRDYAPIAGRLRFDPGVTERTMSVRVRGDRLNESDEEFEVRLFGAEGAEISDGIARGLITNDDPLPELSISDVSRREGDKTYRFRIRLSEPSGRPVTVDFQDVADTATAGDDYIVTQGSVSIRPGRRTASVQVRVKEDESAEPDEAFWVLLNSPVNASIANDKGKGTIRNDDR